MASEDVPEEASEDVPPWDVFETPEEVPAEELTSGPVDLLSPQATRDKAMASVAKSCVFI
jgi:hypothetical protein